MKKEDLYNTFNSIEPTEHQKNRMLNKIIYPSKRSAGMKPKRVLIAALLISLMTTTVIAANFSSFQNLIDRINPKNAEFMETIELVSIDQGIKAEVVAVSRYENMVKAYITIEDLEGDRIDKDFTFMDYVNIKGSNNSPVSSMGSSIVDYDEENNRATLFIEAESSAGFEGETLTFSFTNIFYDRKSYTEHKIDIDSGKIDRNPSYVNTTVSEFMSWFSEDHLFGGFELDTEVVPILTPHNMDYKFPEMDSNIISSVGIIDGNLHVLVWRDKEVEGEGYSIYLVDSEGEVINYDAYMRFEMDRSDNHIEQYPEPNDGYDIYEQLVFDIDTDNLSQYKLYSDYSTSKRATGDWKITFEAEDKANIELKNVVVNEMNFESIGINPFGLTLVSKETIKDPVITINTANEILETSFFSGYSLGGDFGVKGMEGYMQMYQLEDPVNIDQIESITINGVEILIK